MGNPFDFNRNGRWSMAERALTHYGVRPLMRDEGDHVGCGGCGSLMVLLGVVTVLFLFFV